MKTSYIGPTITLLLFLAVLGAYVGLRAEVDAKSVAVHDLNRQIAAKTAEAARLASVKERLASLAGVEGRVQAYFVPETAVVNFINELQSRGQMLSAVVEIDSVAANQGGTNARPALKVALSITGTFDAVARALGSIEYAPYDLSVTSFSLLADTSKKTWTASLNLSAISTKDTPAGLAPPPVFTPQPAATTTIREGSNTKVASTTSKKRL